MSDASIIFAGHCENDHESGAGGRGDHAQYIYYSDLGILSLSDPFFGCGGSVHVGLRFIRDGEDGGKKTCLSLSLENDGICIDSPLIDLHSIKTFSYQSCRNKSHPYSYTIFFHFQNHPYLSKNPGYIIEIKDPSI